MKYNMWGYTDMCFAGRYWSLSLVAISMVLFIGCSKEDDIKTRHFLMGFTPIPYELSSASAEYAYRKLSSEADIINHHFDNGVPWEESLNGTDYDSRMMADWTLRKGKVNAGQKSYVSVTPINVARNGLAAYRGSHENMPLPGPWSTYTFNAEPVKKAYLNYCKRVIDFFHPDYFGMSIEANLLYFFRPGMWTDYLELHEYVYKELKTLYPDLPVFTSVAGAPILEGFLKGNDHVQQRLAAMQLLDFSDDYAISFYPYAGAYGGKPFPENTFDELFSISTKPLVVAETGYTGQKFLMDSVKGSSNFQPDPAGEQKFVDDILAASEKWKANFVIWFTPGDYSQLIARVEPPNAYNLDWRDAGLYDANGNPRPVLNSWTEWFRRRVAE